MTGRKQYVVVVFDADFEGPMSFVNAMLKGTPGYLNTERFDWLSDDAARKVTELAAILTSVRDAQRD